MPRGLSRKQLVLLGTVFAAFAAYLVVLHEQISPSPWFAATLNNPIWERSNLALGQSTSPIVAVVRDAPVVAVGAQLAFFLTLTLSFTLSADRQRARQLLRIVALAGSAYAVVAIVSFMVEPNKILFWGTKTDHFGNLTGPFTNCNTAAVFFGQCAVLWLLYLCEHLRGTGSKVTSSLGLLDRLMIRPNPQTLVSFGMVVTLIGTVFMTGSRAGIVLSLGALSIAFFAYFWKDFASWKAVLFAAWPLGLLLIPLALILGGAVNSRFSLQGLSDEGRWPVYRATSQIIHDFPWLGAGLGSFSAIFPAYRPTDLSVSGVWTRAHDALLELGSETGVIVALGVLVLYLAMISCFIWGIARRPTRDALPPAAGLAALLLAGGHSLVDFSLQIPGYSLIVAVIVGTGLARVLSPPAARENNNVIGSRRSHRRRPL